ncbi:MAG: efflux RND transporter periplasmic adaptor subunit [Panacagrimonas sp.]
MRPTPPASAVTNLHPTSIASRRVAASLVPGLVLLVALQACSSSDAETRKPAAPPAASVEVTPVKMGELERVWAAVGSLQANESVIVRPEITGRIVRIGFAEGQKVSRNTALFELDDSVFVAQIAQARANLALATRNAKRAEELYGRELIATSERDTATASLDLAAASLSLARAQAAKTVIRAPFAGRVGLRSASVGDYVNPGQDLVVIEDLERIKLEFRLPELALPDVREGQDLQVELDAYPGQKFPAKLYAIDSRVADDTRSIAARALLDNADGRLRPGLFARINLVVERKTDALLIPEQAIVARGNRSFVYVVESGKAVEREIRVGQRRDGQVEILSGVQAGAPVVTSGLQRIGDGVPVQAAASPASAPNPG